ncbi:MAG: hypothetical protein IH593_14810 [Bacteroidales bacterium]|nr:hypothetical protein [Bacteroidales bacterium]
MKKITLVLIVITLTLTAGAQTKADEFLKKIPALPVDSCNATRAGVESFTQQVSSLVNEIEDEIGRINRQANQSAGNNEEAAKAAALKQMSQQYGMSQDDIEKMKNAKNLSAADKQAMASRMMTQQTNMSMDEIKNLSKMSEAGKKAYAEGYATEAMAMSQANPNSQPVNNSALNLSQLLSKKQALEGNISASGQKIGSLYSAIENDPSRQVILDSIDMWRNNWISMAGVDYGQGQKMDSLALMIKERQISYCDKYTPKYRSALVQHLKILKASLPDYKSLGEITAQITTAQTGIETSSQDTDSGVLKAMNEYLNKLQAANKFKLYFPED